MKGCWISSNYFSSSIEKIVCVFLIRTRYLTPIYCVFNSRCSVVSSKFSVSSSTFRPVVSPCRRWHPRLPWLRSCPCLLPLVPLWASCILERWRVGRVGLGWLYLWLNRPFGHYVESSCFVFRSSSDSRFVLPLISTATPSSFGYYLLRISFFPSLLNYVLLDLKWVSVDSIIGCCFFNPLCQLMSFAWGMYVFVFK